MPLNSVFRSSRRRFLEACGISVSAAALTACGFRLRGPRPMAFSSIYIGDTSRSPMLGALRRQIEANGSTVVVNDPAKAETQLVILNMSRDREILSLSGSGRVREFELLQSIRFKLINQAGEELLPPTTISARRDYTFEDEYVIAKEEEEEMLFKDMEKDLMEQMLRRLAAVD